VAEWCARAPRGRRVSPNFGGPARGCPQRLVPQTEKLNERPKNVGETVALPPPVARAATSRRVGEVQEKPNRRASALTSGLPHGSEQANALSAIRLLQT